MILCKHIFSNKELIIYFLKVNETEKSYKFIDICDCIKNFKIAISKSNLDKVKHTLFGWQMFSTEPKVTEFVHTIEERTQYKVLTFDDINKLDKIAKKAKKYMEEA